MAYALVVQLVLAGGAVARAAGPDGDGVFSSLLCRSSVGAGRGDAPASGDVPACCQFGCCILNVMAPAPPAGVFAAPARALVRASRRVSGGAAAFSGWRRMAHRARAPPAAVGAI
ncbi:hypothetical protein [Xanthobacter agilis]|uniref:Secreted protein n=1 Tax=Xanthobacter agilis TaxID=47492 RepID=A0ABU0L902_XANAG|nr:hypothetical protein [Xanthobacter agilis]MDQ0503631.1 hypothetical protein [Xanthobacter agilis]